MKKFILLIMVMIALSAFSVNALFFESNEKATMIAPPPPDYVCCRMVLEFELHEQEVDLNDTNTQIRNLPPDETCCDLMSDVEACHVCFEEQRNYIPSNRNHRRGPSQTTVNIFLRLLVIIIASMLLMIANGVTRLIRKKGFIQHKWARKIHLTILIMVVIEALLLFLVIAR